MQFLRNLKWGAVLLALTLVLTPPSADAAKKPKVDNKAMMEESKKAAKSPPWAMGYIMTSLVIILGAAATCIPHRRRDEARPEDVPIMQNDQQK